VDFIDSTGKKKKKKKGVKDKATLKTQVEIPHSLSGASSLDMALTYIACTKTYCLTPRTFEFSVEANIVETAASTKQQENLLSTGSVLARIENNLLLALLLIFFAGMVTSLTPCVYPLIPITLAVLGNNKDRPQMQSFLISVSYVVGIGVTYALLGVLAARTGALFGSLISHPAVVIAMSLIFFAHGAQPARCF
jgi:thiol:disulfide interchange protein DsbD